ncbi:MAG: ABC transporter permease [Yoonia sp.]|nr:ABC transporter permease [Yoonia sp.]
MLGLIGPDGSANPRRCRCRRDAQKSDCTAAYLFAAASIGVLLGKVVRTMAQFPLLLVLIIMPNMILLGDMTPIEGQPAWLQPINWLLPSRHAMEFTTAYRGRKMTRHR